MITVREMTEEEKAWFVQHRQENGMIAEGGEAHGTTLQYSTNDMLRDLIHANFLPIAESELKDPLDRIGCVFGHDDVAVSYKDYERGMLQLDMYNYFGLPQSHFYKGYSEVPVEQWTSHDLTHHRFIWRRGEQPWEINKNGRGYSKDLGLSTKNLQGYTHVGNYTVKVGLRRDNQVFDITNPRPIGGEKRIDSYTMLHIGDDPKFLAANKLVRNNQVIGLIPPEISSGSGRSGDGWNNFRMNIMQCEVLFNPVSSQLNPMDSAQNVQENKNQHNGDSLPSNFTRLIKEIKTEKAKEVWEYFQGLLQPQQVSITDALGQAQAAEEAQAATESESETESSSDEEVVEVAQQVVVPAVVEVAENESSDEEEEQSEEEEEVAPPAAGEAGSAAAAPAVVQEEAAAAPPFQPPQEFRPLPPHDVSPFRRGGVYADELRVELERVLGVIGATDLYRDTKYIELFNLLRQFE